MKKMLKFTELKQETPVKEVHLKERMILTRFTTNTLRTKLKINLVDALNVEYHFVKFIAL